MAWLKTLLIEAWGLFVDDGWLAAASIAWLAIVWQVLPLLQVPSSWRAVALFAGLLAILAGTALQRARRSGIRRPPV